MRASIGACGGGGGGVVLLSVALVYQYGALLDLLRLDDSTDTVAALREAKTVDRVSTCSRRSCHCLQLVAREFKGSERERERQRERERDYRPGNSKPG